MTPEEKQKIFVELIKVVVDIVDASPEGVPAGPMYMAFSEKLGLTHDQFEVLMSALVTAGKIRKSGHQYFPVKKGGA